MDISSAAVDMSIAEFRTLISRCLERVGHTAEEAGIITDHLVDSELRGYHFGGASRAVSILQKLTQEPEIREPIVVEHETPISARVNGGAQAGYLAGFRATEILIAKAQQQGMAVVGLHNTYFSGMLSFYAELATAKGLVFIGAGSSAWHVAPHGSTESRLGTNPIAFGFPTGGIPIITDAAMASCALSETIYLDRLGKPLPAGYAYDADGNPTLDPSKVMDGALTTWGGAKGSAIAIAVQLLGILGGSLVRPKQETDCSLLLIALKPDLLMDPGEFAAAAREFGSKVKEARPVGPNLSPRLPFERSYQDRERAKAANTIEVPQILYRRLKGFSEGHPFEPI